LTAIGALLWWSMASGYSGPAVARADPAPIGAHSMLQLNSPQSLMRAMFAEASGLHVPALRLDVAPALLFTNPSARPDFSGLDEVIALARQYHVRVVADLITIPWWIAACQVPTDIAGMARCATDDISAYRSMIAQIAARADPAVRDWEIWNEPDVPAFFNGTPEQYARMLRSAHDAIKELDPQANVLLGGISNAAGMSWLADVFAAPGADAAHAFDIANIHERGSLDALAGDVVSWRSFLTGYGFTGPVWVTEHGYPSDQELQYDPSFAAGALSQVAYLNASIPTLIDAGAGEVFVTERDNLGGQFASEGLLGGAVSDRAAADPQVVEKPSYAEVRTLADCYASLARDCPGPPPAASPTSLALPPTRLGSSEAARVSVSNPGSAPLQLGVFAVPSGAAAPIGVLLDGCSNRILEPDQTCSAAVRFTPVNGGAFTTTLKLPSDNGTLTVPVTGVAPSVSSLVLRASPPFTPIDAADGVGRTQLLVLEITNPLIADVRLATAAFSGSDARRFRIASDQCTPSTLAAGATCRMSVLFSAARARTAQAVLTLNGDGAPLTIPLHARLANRRHSAPLATRRRPCCRVRARAFPDAR
jgi:hypothetical protein